MKNNQGQVLVLFILLIPIFLLLFALIIDLGLLYNESRSLEGITKESVSYGLKNQDDIDIENKIEMLVKTNKEKLSDITIHKEKDYLQVQVVEKYSGLFPFLFQNSLYEIEVTYYGYLEDGSIVIHKE